MPQIRRRETISRVRGVHKSGGGRELASMVTQIQVDVTVTSRRGSDSGRYHGDFTSETMQRECIVAVLKCYNCRL